MTHSSEATMDSQDMRVAELKAEVADTEELLRETASATGEKMGELRGRLKERLASTKAKLVQAEAAAVAKAKAAARATDDYVHENPWKAVGIAAGAGLVLGLLIGRR